MSVLYLDILTIKPDRLRDGILEGGWLNARGLVMDGRSTAACIGAQVLQRGFFAFYMYLANDQGDQEEQEKGAY